MIKLGLLVILLSFNVFAETKPKHHLPNGKFQNNYQQKEFSFLKLLQWRWESSQLPDPNEKNVQFEKVNPDLEFLKKNREKTTATWIGHSTILLQSGGLNILTDPIFSERASPVQWAGPKRISPLGMEVDELPEIDVVVISHNHYDHLDEASVLALDKRSQGKTLFLIPLKMGRWFSSLGVENYKELDWWQSYKIKQTVFYAVPVQHWSKRNLFGDTNAVLWSGWVIESPGFRTFFAGDTGYSPDFKDIGRKFKSMDLSLIPIGAYNPRWFMKHSHVNPGESLKIHKDVGSQYSIGIHWGTFILTDEPVDEPPLLLKKALAESSYKNKLFFHFKHGQTKVFDEKN